MKSILSFMATLCLVFLGTIAFGQSNADAYLTAQFKVSGITCSGDMPVIKKKLINQEGIDEVSFTEAKNGVVTFTVKYHSSVISEKRVREMIEAAPSCDRPDEYPYKAKSIVPQPKKQ